ncbi:multiheme c-type cytochrome [Desulfogranum japonicum]|uniref:multiheme c-type cytochrome n=1 Tax=Desulfogranum japonicum TaxID=231447 RepID=UPI000491DE15|nr:multiheme c-type cytochrome [Desulfogranum japonicum]
MRSATLFNNINTNTMKNNLFSLTILLPITVFAITPAYAAPQDHSQLTGPYASISEVTAQCLSCHSKQGEEILHSSHWTWTRQRKTDTGLKKFSKKNGLTAFALAAGANPNQCLTCHISSTPLEEDSDTTAAMNIDCLICHDTTGTYSRDNSAQENEQDLAVLARKAGKTTIQNCMSCHGINARTQGEKMHGGIENDIHLQPDGANLTCNTCHPADGGHAFQRTLKSKPGMRQTTGCAVCHTETPHIQKQLNEHAEIIACGTCHIPTYGQSEAALLSWNWLQQGTPDIYQAHDGRSSLLYSSLGVLMAKNLRPVYLWDDGADQYYQRGEKVERDKPVILLGPGKRTMTSKITPFTVTFGTQFIDKKYRYLISPVLEQNSDLHPLASNWDEAAQEGMNKLRLPFSGQTEIITTLTYSRLNHGVVPIEQTLDCMSCHGANSHMNWQQLGYESDPWHDDNGSDGAKIPVKTQPPSTFPSTGINQIQETVLPAVNTTEQP